MNSEKLQDLILYIIDKTIEDIKRCFDELEDVEHKYDYDKLPKDM